MKFIKTEDLKIGMRLARPIFSKTGVLLYDRDSNLTAQTIESAKNFGLLGIYILEPAEPLPPMSEEDREFERFQTMGVFSIQEELQKILTTKKQNKMQSITDMITKNYGHQDGKINFYQNLRSRDDYVYSHSLNVAILCALMSHTLNVKPEELQQTIFAAIVHDIGKISLPGDLAYSVELDDDERMQVYTAKLRSGDIVEEAFGSDGVAIKRVCNQALMMQENLFKNDTSGGDISKMQRSAKVLMLANRFDELTGMNLEGVAHSEVIALKEFYDHPEIYDPAIVKALVDSINLLFPGVSVELNTGDKALILAENPQEILRPMVLSFTDNSIIDLSLKANKNYEIVDIMKTLDNRYVMDTDALKQAGYL